MQPRYALAIHTASPELGLAIDNFAGDRRNRAWNLGRDVSNYLHQYLAEFLQPQTWADLAFIAVAIGPGGFTGTRLGVVTARTLAQQLSVPLFGISTLAAIAQAQRHSVASGAIAVQMRAQRGEVFGAIYQPLATGLQPLMTDTVLPIEAWQLTLQQWPTPYSLIEANPGQGDTTPALLELALTDWNQGQRPAWQEVLPFYGQNPVVQPA